MQDTQVYLELIQERGRKGLPLERVYRQMFNKNLYLTAYGKIYRNAGAMTPGTPQETVDGMSEEKIDTIMEAMRHERYRCNPVCRTYIPKKNGKPQPPGMPTSSDKLVQEVLRSILSAYYEPQFSDHSHGFRPGRGCHTALQEIYYKWPGTNWFIEGDISACFDRLDHELILETLQEKVHDGRIIRLVQNMLDAGYIENWKRHKTLSGTPQGGIISPILSNILLDKLDKYVETVLIPKYTRGEKKRLSPEYQRIRGQYYVQRKRGNREEARKLRKHFQAIPSIDTKDPTYRRLRYVRYADDFLLGFIGPKSEAEEIKREISRFLQEELKLELSKARTLITNARSEKARFLGYEIGVTQADAKQHADTRKAGTVSRRSSNGRAKLGIPKDVQDAYSQKYMRNGKAVHRPELENEGVFDIITKYQLEFWDIANYYKLASNMHTLKYLKWVMEISLTKTLAKKLKCSVNQVYEKYRAEIEAGGKTYQGLRVIVPREGKDPLMATWGGIPLIWDIKATLEDQPGQLHGNARSELEKRLLARECEHCGATDHIEVHHIRALKDLQKYTGREKPEWVKIMAARVRKRLVLCQTCHQDVTYGRPMRRVKAQGGQQ
ncbi:MAG TPA: reverse transcriptase domain-containing protein [Ktedonobacteraceae bacterium]